MYFAIYISTVFFLMQLKYKETFNAEKGTYIGSEDTPQLAHSREVNKLISEVKYLLFHSFTVFVDCIQSHIV